jgi:hypothetical protein
VSIFEEDDLVQIFAAGAVTPLRIIASDATVRSISGSDRTVGSITSSEFP